MDFREMDPPTMEALFLRLEGLVQKDHDLLNQLDHKVGEVLARLSFQENRFDDHERRIRDLEFAKWKLAGIAVVLSAMMPLLISYLSKRLIGG